MVWKVGILLKYILANWWVGDIPFLYIQRIGSELLKRLENLRPRYKPRIEQELESKFAEHYNKEEKDDGKVIFEYVNFFILKISLT